MKHFLQEQLLKLRQLESLDKRKIGSGTKGKLTHELQSIYFDIVKGVNKKYSDWLTYVE